LSEDRATAWLEWLPEAQRVVEQWEAGSSRRLLSTAEAAGLIEHIARALRAAYERGASGA
jgi:hypothetical protein